MASRSKACLTNPIDPDTDADGLDDGWGEQGRRTDPLDPDSDHDGSRDDADNCPRDPNPDQADLDRDGRGDVCDPDVDGDGLNRGAELGRGTDPRQADTDGDGLEDRERVVEPQPSGPPKIYELVHPLDPDGDDDGLEDGQEIRFVPCNTDPRPGGYAPGRSGFRWGSSPGR